ncbi:MAG: hypothetical protein H7061_08765 [Bdellovibrionaceae bacterium]|nr:hypothetical protein [Bdellovibrio sp.]
MSYLTIISQVLGVLALLGSIFWGIRYGYIYLRHKKHVEKIRQIEANIAVLRTLLKAKIKKQVNSIESQFQGDQPFLALVRPQFEQACKIEFSHPGDYQRLVNTLSAAYFTIDNEMQKRVPSLFKNEPKIVSGNENEIQSAMFPKYGSSLVALIQDIELTTTKLKSAIDNFYETTGLQSKLKAPELISIEDFETICSRASLKQEALELDKLRAA